MSIPPSINCFAFPKTKAVCIMQIVLKKYILPKNLIHFVQEKKKKTCRQFIKLEVTDFTNSRFHAKKILPDIFFRNSFLFSPVYCNYLH